MTTQQPADILLVPNTYFLGQVKLYNHKKGYGFITELRTHTDYYVRYNVIRSAKNIPLTKRSLWEGEFVEFLIDPASLQQPQGSDEEKPKGPAAAFVRGIGDYPMFYMVRHNSQLVKNTKKKSRQNKPELSEDQPSDCAEMV
jgi:cold shock CspA family protein